MATKQAPPRPATFARCQILTTIEGQKCPLCDRELVPSVAHYCELRNGKLSVDGEVPNGE